MSRHQEIFRKTMGGPPGKPKRILKDFQLMEISAVDFPAQEAARVALMKRQDHERQPVEQQLKQIGQEIDRLENELRKDSGMNFEKVVEDIKARDKCSGTIAMSKARAAYPKLFQKYQSAGVAIAKRQEATSELEIMKAGRAEQQEVDALVDEISAAQGVSRTEAMQQLRRSKPALFA